MNYKYQVGQQIPVSGIITITGLAHNKNGNPVYDTDRGAVVPELLIERLEMKPLEKVQPEQPKREDKHTYKPGDKVKVIDKTCGHFARIGDVITLRDNDVLCEKNAWHFREGFGYITECDFEPYAEPKQEPVELYCVESSCSGERITVGKTYEVNAHGRITYDDGTLSSCEYGSDAWKNKITGISSRLFPLVSRPAKVGEWVYIENKIGDYTYNVGDIGKAEKTYPQSGDVRAFGGQYVSTTEYLVLDGYKPEPEYFSGKVVCVEATDRGVTLGKVYTVEKGVFTWNNGTRSNTKASTIKQFNNWFVGAKFIEFKGE